MNYQKIRQKVEEAKHIAIVTHTNPDGDAVGSSLGLWHFLKTITKAEVQVITPNDYPKFLHWMPGNDQVRVFYHDKKGTPQYILDADVLFCLDFNSLDRINGLLGCVKGSKAFKVLIDHHLDPEHFAQEEMSKPSASSTAELVYDFIVELEGESAITDDIGQCLFTGITSDTGRFKFATNPRVYNQTSHLVKMGVNTEMVNDRIFNSFSEDRLRLFGFALSERMKVYPEYRAASIYLTAADKAKFNFQPGDSEGLVNHLLSMNNIVAGIFVTEKDKLVKLSLRSKGDFSVQEIASKHFNGGGHKNASGGRSKHSVVDTIAFFESILPDYKEKLLSTTY